MITILHGIGGSHAYGLAHAGSDEDHIGVMSYPTQDFWNLKKPTETETGHFPYDYSFHELEKFLGLAAKSNPTVLETLFLPEYLEKEEYWGEELIAIRMALPSKDYVHNAYIGYAESQFRKLMQRGDGKFSASTGARTPKHARHCMRLLEQGYKLYTTGELVLQVDDPDYYRFVSDMTPEALGEEFTKKWGDFISAESVLPEKPDWDAINDYLWRYRDAH